MGIAPVHFFLLYIYLGFSYALDHLIFSEIYPVSPDGTNRDQFTEIFNPTGEAVNPSQYKLCNDSDECVQLRGTELAAGDYYVICRDRSIQSFCNIVTTLDLGATYGLTLENVDTKDLIDSVNWSIGGRPGESYVRGKLDNLYTFSWNKNRVIAGSGFIDEIRFAPTASPVSANSCGGFFACGPNSSCKQLSSRAFDCVCNLGYEGDPRQFCTDVNECASNPCDRNAFCVNEVGSFLCKCNDGFAGNGLECAIAPTGPPISPVAPTNTPTLNPTPNPTPEPTPAPTPAPIPPGACDNIAACGFNAACQETPLGSGTYSCLCDSGYEGDPFAFCVDKNECASNPCDPNALCINEIGSFRCECKKGFAGDGLTCDVDGLFTPAPTGPTPSPTISNMPSISFQPSVTSQPTSAPSLSHVPSMSQVPSSQPSISFAPSITIQPSLKPSDFVPSSSPTVTAAPGLPSSFPTVSNMPSVSDQPSVTSLPSISPTKSFVPSMSPFPSRPPTLSIEPSITAEPTQSGPTPKPTNK